MGVSKIKRIIIINSLIPWKVWIMLLIFSAIASSQYHYFGRNKIQYTNFNWHVLKTDHFDIYFYPEMEEVAKYGASIAENAYIEYQSKFNHALNKRVPLIMYSSHLHFQQTNIIPYLIPEGTGGFFEFIKGRVVIPSDGSYAQFKHVIRHELIHVFTVSKINRIYKDHQKFNSPGPPLWFIEGIAEYWSQEAKPLHDMVLRDAVLNGYFRPISRIGEIEGSYLMYKEGEDFLDYLSSKMGDEIVLRLMENLWYSEQFEEVFKFTTGMNYKEIEVGWVHNLKQRFFPEIAGQDNPKVVDTQLTSRGFNTKPAVYYDSTSAPHIAFISNRLGYTNIYSKPMKPGVEPRVIIEGEKNPEYEMFHVFRSKIDIKDNKFLAFVTKSGETDVIHIFDLQSNQTILTLKFPDLVAVSSPKWSHSGEKIAFSALDFSGFTDLYVYDLSDSTLKRLTHDSYDDRDPVWTRGDKGLIFSSDRSFYGKHGRFNIFSINFNNGSIALLTFGKYNDSSPELNLSNNSLLFHSDRNGHNDIYLLKLSDDFKPGTILQADLYQLTSLSGSVQEPLWASDSTILYTSFENYAFNIFQTEIEQKSLIPIDMNIGSDFIEKSWHPELLSGQKIETVTPYRGKYSLDIAQGQVVQDPIFGTMGGAQIAVSDVLGNHQYYIVIYNNARTQSEFLDSFNFSVTRYTLSKRTDYGVGFFRFRGLRFNYYEGFYDEERFGSVFFLKYPISHFMRVEGVFNISNSRKDWFGYKGSRKAWIVANYFSFIHDNSIWGISGPIDGSRFLITIGYTSDVKYSNVSYTTLIADYRKYFRLSLQSTYALRIMGLRSSGKEAQRFYIGGSWTLRGYPRFVIWGNQSILWNNELRFPFINNIQVRFPGGTANFGGVKGALFFDVGNAWEDRFDWKKNGLKGSFGIGLRFRLAGYLVLRYDIGRRTDFHSISKENFYQFFFGWDY